jgi:hypothetical protein
MRGLNLHAPLLPVRLLHLTFGVPAGAHALLRIWHAHHTFGDAVCLPLIFISRQRRMERYPAKIMRQAWYGRWETFALHGQDRIGVVPRRA